MNWNYYRIVLENLWHHFKHFFSKDTWIAKALYGVVMYFAGIHLYLISILCLSIIDVITGVWAAKKTGEEITSRKLRRGFVGKDSTLSDADDGLIHFGKSNSINDST